MLHSFIVEGIVLKITSQLSSDRTAVGRTFTCFLDVCLDPSVDVVPSYQMTSRLISGVVLDQSLHLCGQYCLVTW